MRRVTINLLPTSDNPRIRLESYYAVTSNTLQHGARLEAYASALGFSLRGFLQYDVLAQVSPLFIEATFGGGVGIFFGDEEIMGLTLNLTVTGPSPWRVDGEVSFKPFVFTPRVSIGVHGSFGGSDAPALPDVDVASKFREQLNQVRNWKAALPDASQLLVQLKPKLATKESEVLAHPSATIEFNQLALPLKHVIQRFGAAKPAGPNVFDLTGLSSTSGAMTPEPLQSEFAPAQFFELSNDEKMSAPAFRRLDSGIRANPAALVNFGDQAPRIFKYRDHLVDAAAQESPFAGLFVREIAGAAVALAGLAGSAVARSDLYKERINLLATGDEIRVSQGKFQIVDVNTMTPAFDAAHDSPYAANQALGAAVSANPALKGTLMVIAAADWCEHG